MIDWVIIDSVMIDGVMIDCVMIDWVIATFLLTLMPRASATAMMSASLSFSMSSLVILMIRFFVL